MLLCPTEEDSGMLMSSVCIGILVHNAAQENKMNELGSYLFHGVVNQT